MDKQEESRSKELIKSGQNFLGILNDLKRRPEDAAAELGISLEEITQIIDGKKILSQEIIEKAVKIWPVNISDFYIIYDDTPTGVKLMSAEESKMSSRIMNRSGKPYYEYRDTVMSSIAPFRPEWIMELCQVEDNNSENTDAKWNNGHFMHQFTYFIGNVNFYYLDENDKKQVSIMKTGDSMYISPFVPHTFTSRNKQSNGLILALTYGNKLTGDVKQELSGLSTEAGSQFSLDFSTKEKSSASLLKFHREISSLPINEVSIRTKIPTDTIIDLENAKRLPTHDEIILLARSYNVNSRELMADDKIEKKVVVKPYNECKKWYYPENSKIYEFVELASTPSLPFSKAFEINVQNSDILDYDFKVGLHQFIYNVGENELLLNWEFNDKKYTKLIQPGDSIYIKPFIKHNFRGNGKLVVLRVGGRIPGDSQRELSLIGKRNTKREINETMQWFDPHGKKLDIH